MSITFNEHVDAVGSNVCVEILDNMDDVSVGGIYLPKEHGVNERTAFVKIVSLGDDAKKETGLEIGDYALIDRLATHYHSKPIAVLRYNSVICKTNKERNDFFPLKNMLFVKPIKKEEHKEDGVLILMDSQVGNNMGIITKTNFDDEHKYLNDDMPVGSKIMLVKGGDIVYTNGSDHFIIYKHDMPICIFED